MQIIIFESRWTVFVLGIIFSSLAILMVVPPQVSTSLPHDGLSLSSSPSRHHHVRILGGQNATEGEFPFIVSVQMNPTFGNRYHYCGASILNSSYVVTAAHCVEGRPSTQIQVVAGAHLLQPNIIDPNEQRRNITSIHLHPKFNPADLSHDIALLQLSQPFQLNPRVQPIQLSTPSMDFIGNCTVIGFGAPSSSNNDSAQLLKHQNMTRIPNPDCKSIYEFIHPVNDAIICAKGPRDDAMEGPCNGDSGGPLICKDKDSNATVLVGIMSWSLIPCGDPSYPSIYTNISTLNDFIV